MQPTSEQWNDLLDAIKSIAPDPFWSIAIPIVTTLFAVFGGFALSQWNDSAKVKREVHARRVEEVRDERAKVVEYITRWAHGTDSPWGRRKEYAYPDVNSNEVSLLVSLTGDPDDAPVGGAFAAFMIPWQLRTLAAATPRGEYSDPEYEFTPEDLDEMDKHRRKLIIAVRQWEDSTISAVDLVAAIKAIGDDLRAATEARALQHAEQQRGEQAESPPAP